MKGSIDSQGRALLTVEIRPSTSAATSSVNVWIDTGFTGDLVLPKSIVHMLSLPKSGSMDAILADGSPVELNTYTCFIEWFGRDRRLEVVANEGDYPLLGVGLLFGLLLRANYRSGQLALEEG